MVSTALLASSMTLISDDVACSIISEKAQLSRLSVKIMQQSLTKKLILYVTLILVVSFSLNAVWILYLHRSAMDEMLRSSATIIGQMLEEQETRSLESEQIKAERIAQLLAETAPSFIDSFELSQLLKFAKSATEDPDISYVEFISQDGLSLAAVGEKNDVAENGLIEVDIIHEELNLGKVLLGYNHHRTLASIAEAKSMTEEHLEHLHESKNVSVRNVSMSFGISLVIFLVICLILLIVFFIRLITQPLIKGVDVVNQLAQGDLTVDITVSGKDEISQLLFALRNMVAKLKEVIADVKKAAEHVASSSQQMSISAEQMSQGAATQAASSEEASSSVEEMAANIRQNTDNALQTEKIAIKAAGDAQESGQAVAEGVSAMQKIAQKITVIEDITRQTRMLSLNATIEAARAQEHGKGFAVVASEVRALAERSQTAATEINELASSSVSIAEHAGEMLKKLVPDIQKTAEFVQEISAASKEQNTGAEQINRAIQLLDQVTQQNSATSEELSATAEELAAQAEHLQNAIMFFKIDTADQQSTKKALEEAHPPVKRKIVQKRSDDDSKTNRGDEQDDEFERF